jgi:hypothetical protein
VSYSASILSDSSRVVALPFLVTPIEDKFLVYAIGQPLMGKISRGDELISIDGRRPQELVRIIAQITGFPNPKSTEQLAARQLTQRGFRLPASLLPPAGNQAELVFRRPDNSTYDLKSAWLSARPAPRLASPFVRAKVTNPGAGVSVIPQAVAYVSDTVLDTFNMSARFGQVASLGANTPYFLTPASVQALGIQPVRPSEAAMKAAQLPLCEGSQMPNYDCYQQFAGIYTYGGKRILLVRVPSYTISAFPGEANDPRYIKAILSEYQSKADVLVIDDTHNPGGQVSYCVALYSMLVNSPQINAGFAFHADRKSILDFRKSAEELSQQGPALAGFADRLNAHALDLERAYDSGQELGPLEPLFFFDINNPKDDRIFPDPDVQWTKPFVVLADELSFSGGDLFPMLVKANKTATIFGERTGGLGGSVEPVAVSTYSQAELRLTRSLFAPMSQAKEIPFGNVVEDDGIEPDVRYSPTVADFRSGYVEYVKAFSEVAKNAKR